ncbi:ATP:cob(I)alamin adenosyltransferase [archaeon]|nr:ATP:cob(I)alamin adenosyltransferase [archaeon]
MKKVYTKKGDKGTTCDMAGKTLPKDDIRIVLFGKIDSLQASIDLANLYSKGKYRKTLEFIEKKLWQTSGEIARCDKKCLTDEITEKDIEALEKFIDSLGEPPQKFVRFKTQKSISLNECRVRCRELETYLVKLLQKKQLRPEIFKFINRLSSAFFMMSYKQ